MRRIDKITWVYSLFIVSIFGYSAYLRLYNSIHHLSPGAADPYVLMAIAKDLENNMIFREQIYPESFSVILSVFHLLSFLDMLHIVRLFGPLMAIVLVLTVYYLTLKLTSNKWAALIPTFMYGTITDDSQLPSVFARQTTTLTQEFTMIFLLPCLLFLFQYLSTQKKRYLIFYFETVVILIKTHLLVATMACLGIVAIFINGLMYRLWNKKVFFQVLLFSVAAIGVGVHVIVIGWIMGARIQPIGLGLVPVLPQVATTIEVVRFAPLLQIISVLCLFVLGYSIFFCRAKCEKSKYTFLTIFYLLMLSQYQAHWLHLRPMARIILCLALTAPVIVGICFHLITSKGLIAKYLLFHRSFYPVITLSLLLVLGMFFPAHVAIYPPKQYDMTIVNYMRICKEYPPLQWLIVSSPEVYPLALNEGWHLNMGDFLAQYDPFKKELPIDTPHIFFFVEKKQNPWAVAYLWKESFNQRGNEIRRLNEWCEIYRLYHNDMDIFYEDNDLIIYAIHKEKGG